MDVECAHNLAIRALRVYGALRPRRCGVKIPADVDMSTNVGGVRLLHPICLAAGFDKNGVAVHGLHALGFAAVEVGTVTPAPYAGNPRPRIWKSTRAQTIVNKMGLPNAGTASVAENLERIFAPGHGVGAIGISLSPPVDPNVTRYASGAELRWAAAVLASHTDYFTLNLSCPNVERHGGIDLVHAIRRRVPTVPCFVKVTAPATPSSAQKLVEDAIRAGAAGLIIGNSVPGPRGAISGAPAFEQALLGVRLAAECARGKLAIIGCGGILSADDAYLMIRAGASAVQVYSALVFGGPFVARRMVHGLAVLLRRDGFRSVSAAVGMDVR